MEALKICLVAGLKEEEFWAMTYGEINRYLEAYNKKERLKSQREATNIYLLAQLIADNIAPMVSKEHKPKQFMEIFKHLYEEETLKEVEKEKELKEAKTQSAKFRMFAEMQNKRRSK